MSDIDNLSVDVKTFADLENLIHRLERHTNSNCKLNINLNISMNIDAPSDNPYPLWSNGVHRDTYTGGVRSEPA